MLGSKKSISPSKTPSVNPHESLSGLSRFFVDELKSQVDVKRFASDAVEQIGVAEVLAPRSGDMEAGKAIHLSSKEKQSAKPTKEAKPKGEVHGGIDYRREVVHGVQMRRGREQQELEQKLQQITDELKRLVSSSTILSNEYASISVNRAPTSAGKYHVNFFDFMLSVIRNARMKVEDSGAWMQVSKKKNGYQSKAQSLGTKFTLSQERSTATQTG